MTRPDPASHRARSGQACPLLTSRLTSPCGVRLPGSARTLTLVDNRLTSEPQRVRWVLPGMEVTILVTQGLSKREIAEQLSSRIGQSIATCKRSSASCRIKVADLAALFRLEPEASARPAQLEIEENDLLKSRAALLKLFQFLALRLPSRPGTVAVGPPAFRVIRAPTMFASPFPVLASMP